MFFLSNEDYMGKGYKIKKEQRLAPTFVNLKSNTMKNTLQRYGDKITGQDVALNDIVISRVGPPLRVIGFNNYVNDGYLNSYNADGIIIATPTGSTGYSLSCGGPIISPNAAMTVMTPIAPHTLNTRSIIFPEDDVITVELGEGRRQIQENGLASFDGDVEVPMSTGDRIVIKKASVSVKILKLNHLSFVEVLRQKMSNN